MSDFTDLRQNARLEQLERRVDAILEHLGIPDPVAAPSPVSSRVAALVREGRTMEAIKLHMNETGADLASAKDAVASVT